MLKITEVKNNKDLKEFINFQYKLYCENNFFVPPLRKNVLQTFDTNSNPAFEFCTMKMWLAKLDGKTVGRIAGIHNKKYNETTKTKYIRFAWLDFIDDKNIVNQLVKKVQEWGKELKMEKIHGPIGLTNFDPCGVLVEGFDEIATSSSVYNFPYYVKYLEELNFQKENDWIEFKIPVPDKTPEQLHRIAAIVKKRYNLQVFNPQTKDDLLKYGEQVFKLMNEAYKGLYGVLEFTEQQIDYYIKQYLPSIPPRYVSMVMQNDELVAFGISMPSLAKALKKSKGKLFPFGFIHLVRALKTNTIVDLMLIAVKPELQSKGVNSIMFDELIPKYIEDGIKHVETNSEMENNKKVQSQWKFFEPKLVKRKRSYVADIQELNL